MLVVFGVMSIIYVVSQLLIYLVPIVISFIIEYKWPFMVGTLSTLMAFIVLYGLFDE